MPTRPSLVEEAPETLEVSTGVDDTPAVRQLTGGTTTGEAVSRLFSEQRRVMETNLEGVCRDDDPEFLHDFRIAVRKARSLLGCLKDLVPPEDLEQFREGFSWLSSLTGPVRDADVHILGFDDLKAGAPEEMRDDLLPFLEMLKREKRGHHEALVRALRSERYRALIDRWGRFVAEIGRSPEGVWGRPVGDWVSPWIRKLYDRFLREGDALDGRSGDECYHELRKTGKKLRYMMEFFRAFLDEAAIGRAIKKLKRLQDELGGFQDCSTQAATLRRCGEEMPAGGAHPAATRMTLDMLIQGLEERKRDYVRAFRRRFASFPREATRAALGPRPGRGAVASESPRQLEGVEAALPASLVRLESGSDSS